MRRVRGMSARCALPQTQALVPACKSVLRRNEPNFDEELLLAEELERAQRLVPAAQRRGVIAVEADERRDELDCVVIFFGERQRLERGPRQLEVFHVALCENALPHPADPEVIELSFRDGLRRRHGCFPAADLRRERAGEGLGEFADLGAWSARRRREAMAQRIEARARLAGRRLRPGAPPGVAAVGLDLPEGCDGRPLCAQSVRTYHAQREASSVDWQIFIAHQSLNARWSYVSRLCGATPLCSVLLPACGTGGWTAQCLALCPAYFAQSVSCFSSMAKTAPSLTSTLRTTQVRPSLSDSFTS